MQVFRIRCCKQLHRVYFDGKRWAIPDCDTPEKKILLALNQQDSSCMEFMRIIRELVTNRRDISYVRPHLAQVGIGNQELVRCVQDWLEKANQVRPKKRHETISEYDRLLSRWAVVINKQINSLGIGRFEINKISRGSQGCIYTDGIILPESLRLPIVKMRVDDYDLWIELVDKNGKTFVFRDTGYNYKQFLTKHNNIDAGPHIFEVSSGSLESNCAIGSLCPFCKGVLETYGHKDLEKIYTLLEQEGYRRDGRVGRWFKVVMEQP